MDFATQFDDLQQRVDKAKAAAQAAVTESPDEVEGRIEGVENDLDRATDADERVAGGPGAGVRKRFAQMKADAAAGRASVKAKIDKANREMDASVAAGEAEWAQADALAALDHAGWAVDNAQLAVLDAIYAQTYADERARQASR